MGKSDTKKPCLDLIQSGVGSHHLIIIPFFTAVITVHLHICRNFRIIAGDRPAVTESTEIFGRIKGKTADITKAARHFAVIHGSMRLRTVLDQIQSVFFRDLTDLVHLTCLSVQMYRQHCLCPWCDLLFYLCCIDPVICIRLHKNRRCTIDRNAHDTGNICVGLHDHFIPGSDPKYTECQPECIQSACQPYAVFCTDISCKFFFKAADFFSQHIPAAAQHFDRFFFKFFLILIKPPVKPVWHNLHIRTSLLPAFCIKSHRVQSI